MSQFNTIIQLSDKGYLDITENINVPLTFSVAEIQDISKKQGSYSKTIILAGTANNNILLGNLFDVNITDSTFNPNIREECIILQNGVPVFTGFLQLLNVRKTSSGQGGLDDFVEYEVAVKDSAGDFYSSLDGVPPDFTGYLTDFDFSQYDHIYTLSAITATSAHTWTDVYKYHMYYNLKDYYEITDFKPSIFAKHYWDQIFLAAGYSYQWTGLTATGFDKMIIPCNVDKPFDDTTDLEFMAGFTGRTQFSLVHNSVAGGTGAPGGVGPIVGLDTWRRDNTKVIFNDDFTDPYSDDFSIYNASTGIYTSNYYGSNTFKGKYYYELYLSTPVSVTLSDGPFGATTGNALYTISHYFKKDATYVPLGSDYTVPNYFGTRSFPYASVLPAGETLILSGYTDTFNYLTPVVLGTTFQYNVNVLTNFYNTEGWFETANPLIYSEPSIILKVGINSADTTNNFYKDVPTREPIGEGRTLRMNNYIPNTIKWKEFVSSIAKLFNLYITPSKENDKEIIIQTRDEFYDSGQTLDWSNKIDLSREHKIQFLPDLQSKNVLFTYKDATSDPWNSSYKSATGEIYGQALYTFENEFAQSVKKIEPIFEATPLNETFIGGGRNIVSSIDSQTPKTGLRILYDGGWISGNSWTYITQSGSTTASTVFNGTTHGYPYAGHFYPNPIQPTDDLNWALPDYLYYDSWISLTNNGLFNKYYKRFISQIETGKLLTAYFRLNENDILNIDFRNNIFIHDSYWFINKIIDYNANTKDGLTLVELINVDDGINFDPFNLETLDAVPPADWSDVTFDVTVSAGKPRSQNILGGNNGNINLLGNKNVLQYGTRNSNLIGDNNSLEASNSILLGNNNLLYLTNSFVQGDNNIGGLKSSIIVGDNINASGVNIASFGISNANLRQDNLVYLGSTLYYVNIINAGRDEVLNAFPLNKTINYISGSRDSVRQLGTESIESKIDAGRDMVL